MCIRDSPLLLRALLPCPAEQQCPTRRLGGGARPRLPGRAPLAWAGRELRWRRARRASRGPALRPALPA
eukprot:5506007-Alexandrium_andersonii.AAC.1